MIDVWISAPLSPFIAVALSLERYIQQLDDINRDADDLLSNITDDQVNRQPGEGRWSIGQCFSHLVVSGRGIASRPARHSQRAASRTVRQAAFPLRFSRKLVRSRHG